MVRDFFQHAVQGAGLLTDCGHLDCHAWEQAAVMHRLIQLHACGYIVAHTFDCLFEGAIADGAGHRTQCLYQRDARRKGGG